METQTQIICPPDLTSRPLGLTLDRFIALPIETIFRAWTTQFDLWLASPGSFLSRGEVNTPFYFETYHQGIRHPHYGRFLKIEAPHKVEITWITGEGGTEGAETVLTIELTAHDETTFLHLTHAGFPNEASRNKHQEAWPYILDQLENRMSRPAD